LARAAVGSSGGNEFIRLSARGFVVPGERIQHADDYKGNEYGWVHSLLQKTRKFGSDSIAGRGADYTPGRTAFDKTKQSWDGLDVVNEAEVEAVVCVYLDDFDFSDAIGRQFLEYGIEDLTGATP